MQTKTLNPRVGDNTTDGSEPLLSIALAKIRGRESVQACLLHICDIYDIDNLAYHATGSTVLPHLIPYIRNTYPSEWIKRYVEQGYLRIDPVVNEGFGRSLPFDWRELSQDTPEQKAFFEDARVYGVGLNGLSIPLIDKSGHRALFSVSSSLADEDWSAFKANYLKDFLELSHVIHSRATVNSNRDLPDIPKLSSREIECLHWIAQGKETPDIAIILGLSEHTIRSYLKSARFKLGCSTLAHAIFRCVELGILKI